MLLLGQQQVLPGWWQLQELLGLPLAAAQSADLQGGGLAMLLKNARGWCWLGAQTRKVRGRPGWGDAQRPPAWLRRVQRLTG